MFAWQATVQDEFGNIVPDPIVAVYEEDGATLAEIFTEAGTPMPNPFTGGMDGFVQFWANAGEYKIVGTFGLENTAAWSVFLDTPLISAVMRAEVAADAAEQYVDDYSGLTATATTLPAGTPATAVFDPISGVLTLGVPQGVKGDQGDSFTVDAVGGTADRYLYDGEPVGFSFLDTDAGELYIRIAPSGWSNGIPFGKGGQGDPGPQGDPGAAATVAAGTTTTGAAGTNASVTNSGTSSAAVFNFTIPRGDTGAQGIQGIQGIQGDKGDKGDKGDTGEQGIQGIQGPQGDPGPAGTTDWNALTNKPSVIAAGATEQAARDAVGALAKSGDTGAGGYTSAVQSLGTSSGQTFTPSPTATSNFKTLSNTGAFTLAAPTTAGAYSIAILVTNGASGNGAMTATGFNKVTGTFKTTASLRQILTIEVFDSVKVLTIRDAS